MTETGKTRRKNARLQSGRRSRHATFFTSASLISGNSEYRTNLQEYLRTLPPDKREKALKRREELEKKRYQRKFAKRM